MLTKQEKIDKIYSIIADKTLSFGCKIYNPDSGLELKIYIDEKGLYHGIDNEGDQILFDNKIKDRIWVIIGHPVMIGDLLDYMEVISKGEDGEYTKQGGQWIAENGGLVIFKWKEKRKPIEEQSEECIEYIYNLIE